MSWAKNECFQRRYRCDECDTQFSSDDENEYYCNQCLKRLASEAEREAFTEEFVQLLRN